MSASRERVEQIPSDKYINYKRKKLAYTNVKQPTAAVLFKWQIIQALIYKYVHISIKWVHELVVKLTTFTYEQVLDIPVLILPKAKSLTWPRINSENIFISKFTNVCTFMYKYVFKLENCNTPDISLINDIHK